MRVNVPVAFCERERDLARMTILRAPDGSLVARLREPSDRISPTFQTGSLNDLWRHRRSGGTYVRHDVVIDLEDGSLNYDYSSWTDGRLWLRPVSEWSERSGDGPRFEPLCDRARQHRETRSAQ